MLLYDRAAIAGGEVWRLATGHFLHVDLPHLAWNVSALLGLGWLFEEAAGEGAGRLAAAATAGCAGVSVWLLLAEPDLARYCGLSGALNAVYAVLLVDLWRRTGWMACPALIAADAAKIAWEWSAGDALLTAISWPSIPGAHAAGLATGLLYAAMRPVSRRPACASGAGAAR